MTFGAGGVCVAIGELADGLEIDLDKVPLKYQGLKVPKLPISVISGTDGCSGSSRRCRCPSLQHVTKKILMLLSLQQ